MEQLSVSLASFLPFRMLLTLQCQSCVINRVYIYMLRLCQSSPRPATSCKETSSAKERKKSHFVSRHNIIQ